MRPLWAMVKANLKMSVRNRTALFWNLAFPAIFILIFGAVFGRDDAVEFDVGVVGPPSPLRDGTVAAMAEGEAFTAHVGDEAEELEGLEEGDRDVVLVFGDPDGGATAVRLYYDETGGPTARVAVGAVRQVVMGVELGLSGREEPLAIEERAVTGEDISYIEF